MLSVLTVRFTGEQIQEGEAASQGSQSKDILRDVSPLPRWQDTWQSASTRKL